MPKARTKATDQRIRRVKAYLEQHPTRTFTLRELHSEIERHRTEWELTQSARVGTFAAKLAEAGVVREIVLRSDAPEDRGYPPIHRWAAESASPYALGVSLRAGSYLSHGTAIALHGLTDQLSKTIYVNKEQSVKPSGTGLTQESLDRAFKNLPRTSNFVFAAEGHRYVILSGKNTGRLEVADVVDPMGCIVPVTKLERTLIDIAVRPSYAGGVFEVARAFRAALDKISIPVLVATLRKLDYVYPYHQAVGFYLQRAGMDAPRLEKLKGLGLNYDFYLANRMSGPKYDKDWRLFYPDGM